ncbi:DUF3995 domain-containing protein [Rathayibacter soli]|uniref:DUF3995 domain-containing protein n=1 Tax=Rathayibacter soli TaxID=3144168 RepID=UPI0027E45CB9|nr:DUF3995 domain-containing protein [Glaciibacter superstes]
MNGRVEARARAVVLAWAAFVIGITYAAISVYWAVGGTWLLSTVGVGLARADASGQVALVVAVWFAVVVKGVAAVLPVVAVQASRESLVRKGARVLTWAEAAILSAYGLVLTVVGVLVQLNVIGVPPSADHLALRWHAYLWDPRFLVWGIVIGAAMIVSRIGSKAHRAGFPDR